MGLVERLLTRVIGSGRVSTAAYDAPVAGTALARHLVRAQDLPLLDAATRTPGRWYHSTPTASMPSIMAAGFDVQHAGSGMYGAGHYFSSIPDAHYGAGMVSAAVRATNPFVVKEGSRFMDVHGFQQAVRPVVERFTAAHPEQAAGLGHAELARRALLDAGHDSILVTRRPWEPQWLVALTDDQVRVVTRPA
ncbi:MAG: hypothetical protein JWL76_1383 [Thermoleophilia bacterium]|nr:hypothetical protein [Thermoleophilia bacterium]